VIASRWAAFQLLTTDHGQLPAGSLPSEQA